MNEIRKEFEKYTEISKFIQENTSSFNNDEVLCVFDIDNTITMLECEYAYWPNICKYKNELNDIFNKYTDIDLNFVYMNILINYPTKIHDKDILNFINEIKFKKIMLTASATGPYKDIDLIEKVRFNILKNLGVSFENEFNLNEYIQFKNYKKNFESYPSYYKGIIFTNSINKESDKGQILIDFLKLCNFSPKCIILIDDNESNHDNFVKELNTSDIKLINIKYYGAEEYCPKEVTKEDFINFWEKNLIEARKELLKRYNK